MAASTVNGRLVNPVTSLPVGGQVTILLVDYDDTPAVGFDATDHTEILSAVAVIPAPTGAWTAQLAPNANIELVNGTTQTAYRVTESTADSTETYWILVTATSPSWVGDLRTTLVGTSGGSVAGLAVAGDLTVQGNSTLNGTVTLGHDPVLGTQAATKNYVDTHGGAVASVNGHIGVVVLNSTDVGALAAANNLSDVASATTARTNLGLGNSATRAVGTTTGTVAAGDDSRIVGALQATSAATTVVAETGYGQSGAVGVDTTYAREDHTHGTPALTSAAPAVTEGIGQAAAVGTASTPARADHVHPMAAAGAPGASAVGDTQATGTATTFAASDHRHAREAFAAPTATTTYGLSAVTGTAPTLAHSDHTHGTPSLTNSAPAATLGIGTAAALGTATTPARGDHVHPMAAAGTPTNSAPGDVAATGSATTFAASDHLHGREASGSSLVKIGSTVLGADAPSITISVSTTYNVLLAYWTARSDAGNPFDDLAIRFNGDTGTNYQQQVGQANAGFVAAAGATSDRSRAGTIAGGTGTANYFGGGEFTVVRPGSSVFKNHSGTSAAGVSGGSAPVYGEFVAGQWLSTAAITSVTILPVTGSNLKAGSSLTLYGLS